MEAVLNVDNLAYCKLEIEDTNMPASFNIIDHIVIQEGFGISIPTLTLLLMDQTGSLQNEMNLVQGTKCSISLAKNSRKDKIIKRTFSLWGMKRGMTSTGPVLEVVFILDVPKWSAGVYCENFRSTSDEAMQRIASASGLRYDGPGGTDDQMNWLNVNTTRSSFSEDMAMRGFANTSSCMSRVLTMDSELRYKDLFDVLKQDPTASLLLNSMDDGHVNPYGVRETQESSMSGVMAHWFNYGQMQHEHSLDQKGQQLTDRILAPVLGDSFPISDRVKGLMSDSVASRVTYTGWDPGTEPNPGSNIHEYYERAFYQNLRGLGLFSERIRTMVMELTDIRSFDCAKYFQNDPVGHQMVPSKSLNGKYLVAGKTIRIKNGHVYSEVFDLLRPYLNNPGKSEQTSGGPKKRKAKANAGAFDLTEGKETQLTSSTQGSAKKPQKDKPAPEMERAKDLMDGLDEYADAVPDIPDEPMKSPGSMSPSDKQALAQDKVRKAIAELQRDDNPIGKAIEKSRSGFDPNSHSTVKRVSASAVKTSANATISEMQQHTAETGAPPSGPEGLDDAAKARSSVKVEKPVMDRYSADGEEIKKKKFQTTVTKESAEKAEEGDYIGDILKGGAFVEDFLRNGRDNPEEYMSGKMVDAMEHEDKKGQNFVFPASKFGLGAEDAVISPKQVAEFVVEFAQEREDPEAFLKKKGPKAYEATFGNKPPDDAKSAAKELKRVAGNVNEKFGVTEMLAAPFQGNEQAGPGSMTPNHSIADGRSSMMNPGSMTPNGPISDSASEVASESGMSAGSMTPNFSIKDGRPQNDEKSLWEKAKDGAKKLKNIKDELEGKTPGATVKHSGTGLDVGGFVSMDGVKNVAKEAVRHKRKGGSNPDYAQAFDFQFGEKGVSPLMERVVSKGTNQDYSEAETLDTVRDARTWGEYARIGNKKAKEEREEDTEDDGIHWEFPHVLPFEKQDEGDGEAMGMPDTPSSF